VALNGSAAVAGILLARKFGRGAETDGFMAAYGVYLVLVLGAQAFRFVVVPDLTRAAGEGRLAAETRAYGAALALPALLLAAATVVFAGPLGDAVTGSLPAPAAALATDSLRWLVPAACAQVLAGLAASALAARSSYGVAALGYTLGSLAGLGLFVALADAHGLVALAWGTALNGAITLGIPLAALVARGDLAGGRAPLALLRRLRRFAEGAAVPLALQVLYLICLRLAADVEVGAVTSFSYAYLLAATLVAATAGALALVTSAPLTRRGVDGEGAAAYVVHASWLCLVPIAAAAGALALAGGRIVSAFLGGAYSGDVGADLGRLVVVLAPWMVAALVQTLTFPLVFVTGRTRGLVPLALAALAFHVAVAFGLRELFGLPGLAVALAVSTLAVAVVLMARVSPRLPVAAAGGLARLLLVVGAAAAAAFGLAGLLLEGVPAAAAGLAAYALVLAALRPRGLRAAWAHVRAL
jgi:peptidoglycan biosynthesis protein MviN/MurJ (putative lipid II flippase)